MWEKLLQFGKELLSLKKQTEDNTSEIKEIRQDIKDLTEAVRELASQMQQDRTNNAHQQEIMIEKLKNALLQMEIKLLKGEFPTILDNNNDEEK
jgi:archaellum component FlaC